MSQVKTITANWDNGRLSSDLLSMQYDHMRTKIQWTNYPQADKYKLIVYAKVHEEDKDPVFWDPVELSGPEWIIPNTYTQVVQEILFQLCAVDNDGHFEAHSRYHRGSILKSLNHEGETVEIDPTPMFDAYREWVQEQAMASGAIIIDSELSGTSTNPVQNKVIKAALDDLGNEVDNVNGRLQQDEEDILELQNGGYVADQQQIGAKINAWLNNHPEATTTVQDGSLTEAKLSAALKSKVINNYVTPEMYGAKGDGVTDDTNAIQQAINNTDGKGVYLSPKTYKTTGTLYLNNLNFVNEGSISYTGAEYAVVLSPSANIDGVYIHLGKIYAYNGNGLLIEAKNAWIQYATFDFIAIGASAAGNCVTVNIVGAKWCNEIRFINGRFTDGLNGIYIDRSEKTGSGFTSHWTFDKVGFEGCTNGVNIPANITRLSFANCRAEESISNVVYSRAEVTAKQQAITWVGSPVNELYWQNCRNYYLLCLSGFVNSRGAYISVYPIVYYNEMLYGLKYQEGKPRNLSSYGAYSYDEVTAKQEIDFSKVYDYTTPGTDLYERAQSRIFNMNTNNTSATETNVYLDPRMFIDFSTPSNSFLLTLVQSPNNVLNIYDSKGGTLIYSKTNGGSTTYPALVITNNRGLFIIEQVTVTRKSI